MPRSSDADQGGLGLLDGRAILVLLQDKQAVVWWGTDGDLDRVAAAGGQVLTWATVDRCRRHALNAGWARDLPVDPDADVGSGDIIDCRPAQDWLRRPGTALDPASALSLWNLQWDLVATQTGAYPALDRLQARCHHELTVASVPWLVGVDTYRPRWSATELRCLRAALNSAVHDVRTALAPPHSRSTP